MEKRLIRVAHLFNGTHLVGSPISIRWLLNNLNRVQFDPILVATTDGAFVDLLRDEGWDVKVVRLGLDWALNDLMVSGCRNPVKWLRLLCQLARDIVRIREFIEASGIDIVHTHHHHHHLLGALVCGRRTPLIWHVRAIMNTRAMMGLPYAVVCLLAAYCAPQVIGISNAVVRVLPSTARAKSRVIYNGINIDRYRDINPVLGKRCLGFSESAVLVGAVGRFDPHKGFLDFVNAAGTIADRCPTAHFLLVGPCDGLNAYETAYREACVGRIRELGLGERFHLTGKIDRPWKFMAGLDILVLPTVAREGLGNVVIEAHASGVPVVSTDCGGPSDVIVEGQTGFIVPCGDAEAMGRRILQILRDDALRGRMRIAARKRAEEPCFNIRNTVRAVEDVYLSIAGRTGRPLSQ